MHPPLHDVKVLHFDNPAGDGKGVAAIVVEAGNERPYLVANMLDETDQSIGAYFGFFERKQDAARKGQSSIAGTCPVTSAAVAFHSNGTEISTLGMM